LAFSSLLSFFDCLTQYVNALHLGSHNTRRLCRNSSDCDMDNSTCTGSK